MNDTDVIQVLQTLIDKLVKENNIHKNKLSTPDKDFKAFECTQEYITHQIRTHLTAVHGILVGDVIALSDIITAAFRNGNKILICGNGGSAADAQHIAAEFVVKFNKPRIALPAIALNTDTSILTACANDFCFDAIYSRQVEALGNEGDVLIAISTSGNSKNVIEAINMASSKEMIIVGISGKNGFNESCSEYIDIEFKMNTDVTARIQEMYMLFLHLVCDLVDKQFTLEEENAEQ